MDALSHESDDRLELYALGRLSDSELPEIEEHLLVCDSCRDRLDETEMYVVAMQRELALAAVPAKSAWSLSAWSGSSWFRPQFAWGGAMALVAVGVILVWNGNSRLSPVASLELTAMRGSDLRSAPPSRELDLTLGDATAGAGSPLVEVVDDGGGAVWQGAAETNGGKARVKLIRVLSPGVYYVRLYDSPGHLVHEYSFRVGK